MKTKARQWLVFSSIAAALMSCVVILGIVVYQNTSQLEKEPTLTERIVQDLEEPTLRLECQTGEDHFYTFVRCQTDVYGSMAFLWIDENGKQFIIGDGVYTKDYGVIFSVGVEEIVVTFTDMNGNTAYEIVKVPSQRRQCTAANNCRRVRMPI